MIFPEFMDKGGYVGVTAPSDGSGGEVDRISLDSAQKKLLQQGYPVIETPNVRLSQNGRSGTAADRAEQFNKIYRDERIKWIISVKGGDFLCEILSLIDYPAIKKHPKWIQGYSDNTALLFTVTTNCNIATIYGNNFKDFGMEQWHSSLNNNIKIAKGNLIVQESFDLYQNGFHDKVTGLEGYQVTEPVYWKCGRQEEKVSFDGRIIGGCLDVLLSLVGTRYDKMKDFLRMYQVDGIFWYLESFDLNDAALLRGLWQLKEAGWFQYAKGFVFGRPCFYKSFNNASYEQTVLSVLGSLKVPVIFDADIGHKAPRLTIINGALGKITCENGKGSFAMSLKR